MVCVMNPAMTTGIDVNGITMAYYQYMIVLLSLLLVRAQFTEPYSHDCRADSLIDRIYYK